MFHFLIVTLGAGTISGTSDTWVAAAVRAVQAAQQEQMEDATPIFIACRQETPGQYRLSSLRADLKAGGLLS